jgi:hypothetical protein
LYSSTTNDYQPINNIQSSFQHVGIQPDQPEQLGITESTTRPSQGKRDEPRQLNKRVPFSTSKSHIIWSPRTAFGSDEAEAHTQFYRQSIEQPKPSG